MILTKSKDKESITHFFKLGVSIHFLNILGGKEPSIIQSHFTILQKVVQDRQDVTLGFLNTIQYKNSTIDSSTYSSLIHIERSAILKFSALLKIRICNIFGQCYIFNPIIKGILDSCNDTLTCNTHSLCVISAYFITNCLRRGPGGPIKKISCPSYNTIVIT